MGEFLGPETGASGLSYSADDLIDPHFVVRMGETKFFSSPFLNLIFQETVPLSSSRRTRTL